MGWQRAYAPVMEERLIKWFLVKRNFPMTIEQLADMMKTLEKPARVVGSPFYNEFVSLRAQVRAINAK